MVTQVRADGGDGIRGEGLYPNVDFYTASVYQCLGVQTDLFTPIFPVSRMASWTALVMGRCAGNRLIRAGRQDVGGPGLSWVPLAAR